MQAQAANSDPYQEDRAKLVLTLRQSGVKDQEVLKAIERTPREVFVPSDKREAAYADTLVDLGDGRVILDARTLAKMLNQLDILPSDVVLDIGCGLGYSTAVLANLADFVVGVEEDEARVDEAQRNLSEQGVDNAAVFAGPLAEGQAKSGPYDVILLQGAAGQVPEALLDQLKDGGRICGLFADGHLGEVRIGYKIDGTVTWRSAFNAMAPVLPGFEGPQAFTF